MRPSHWHADVVLTVPKLEGMGKGEVCRLLKARMGDEQRPIVFLADQSDTALVDLARRYGADGGLSKLEGQGQLFEKLRRLCRQPQTPKNP